MRILEFSRGRRRTGRAANSSPRPAWASLTRALLAAALALATACSALAQTASTGSNGSATAATTGTTTASTGNQAAAGAPKAAPGAMPPGFGPSTGIPENRLRRFEIVSLGAFPIMLFYTGFAFDLQGYFAHSFDKAYAPWPFKNASSASLSNQDIYLRLGASLGLSFVVGGIDAVLHDRKLRKAADAEFAAGSP
jgi:hypothetical protein